MGSNLDNSNSCFIESKAFVTSVYISLKSYNARSNDRKTTDNESNILG